MHAEIEHNAKMLDGALATLKSTRAGMQQNVDAMTRIQRNDKDPAAQNADLHGGFNLTGLEDTAWLTAQATGALAWMPYDEAERFSSVYKAQQAFESQQDKIQQDSSIFLGLVRRIDPDKGHLTGAEAATLNERFGIWQGDLLLLDLAARPRRRRRSCRARRPAHANRDARRSKRRLNPLQARSAGLELRFFPYSRVMFLAWNVFFSKGVSAHVPHPTRSIQLRRARLP